MHDLVGRQAVKDWLARWEGYIDKDIIARMQYRVIDIPSAQPEIIYCKDCNHWKKTDGDERWSLGDCDFFDKKLVMCEGFCRWAERREE